MKRKLTPEKVRRIRRLRAIEKPTLRKLGDDYGVSAEAVRRIVNGTLWTSVPMDRNQKRVSDLGAQP